jgi:hypothetical protein
LETNEEHGVKLVECVILWPMPRKKICFMIL